MEAVKLKLNGENGAFYLMDRGVQIGEMAVSVSGLTLTVYHTEVAAKAEGKGAAKKMLDAMADYAEKYGLKVIPLCPYVHAQFKKHPEAYAAIWHKA